MIDFRYHLVSIVAIFLALALGIVLGSTTLSNSVSDTLRDQANSAAKSAQDARTAQRQLQHQISGEEQMAQVLSPQLVANRLRGQSVVLIETPGAGNDSIEQMSALAQKAGAAFTGRVTIQKKFLDDGEGTTLDELAAQLKPDGVTFPDEADAYGKAAAVLAAAIVTKDASKTGREDAAGGSVLNGFKEAGYITTTGKVGQHATLAIMVAPSAPYSYEGGDADDKALISVAAALDSAARGTVVGGPLTSAQGGGLIAALRDSGTGKTVSTDDMVDTNSGQIVTILALQNELGGKSGHYGSGAGANGYLPSPAPTAGKNG